MTSDKVLTPEDVLAYVPAMPQRFARIRNLAAKGRRCWTNIATCKHRSPPVRQDMETKKFNLWLKRILSPLIVDGATQWQPFRFSVGIISRDTDLGMTLAKLIRHEIHDRTNGVVEIVMADQNNLGDAVVTIIVANESSVAETIRMSDVLVFPSGRTGHDLRAMSSLLDECLASSYQNRRKVETAVVVSMATDYQQVCAYAENRVNVHGVPYGTRVNHLRVADHGNGQAATAVVCLLDDALSPHLIQQLLRELVVRAATQRNVDLEKVRRLIRARIVARYLPDAALTPNADRLRENPQQQPAEPTAEGA